MDQNQLVSVMNVDSEAQNATRQFHHSAVAARTYDPQLGHIFGEIELRVADIALLGMLGEIHTLVTGPSGDGKTQLLQLLCEGVFGSGNWYLQKLTPHLNEDVFTNVNMQKLRDGSLKDAVTPADFLSLACTVLDEINRTPAALTNVLLGFLDGRIETRAGLKFDVGQACPGDDGEKRFHVALATMNDGKDYEGTFPLDLALSRRFTLRVPFGDLRPTAADIVAIYEDRTGHLTPAAAASRLDDLIVARDGLLNLRLEPLAFLYLDYLTNLGRCPHLEGGYHPANGSQEHCLRAECRIQKLENAFCPSVGGLSPGVGIFLKRAACALAALRAARTISAVHTALDRGYKARVEQLRNFVGARAGAELRSTVTDKYLENLTVTLEDVCALVPFVALGKVWMASEYVAKNFNGSRFLAMQHYAKYAHQQLVGFIRQNGQGIRALGNGSGNDAKLLQRLEHAERTTDPSIKHVIGPFLERRKRSRTNNDSVIEEIQANRRSRNAARHLIPE